MLHIQVVGPSCINCQTLEKLCFNVVAEQDLDANIEKITDVRKYADLGIFVTPALIVNGKVLSMGKIPTKHTLAHWLAEANNHGESSGK